jgi:hypothetical protein
MDEKEQMAGDGGKERIIVPFDGDRCLRTKSSIVYVQASNVQVEMGHSEFTDLSGFCCNICHRHTLWSLTRRSSCPAYCSRSFPALQRSFPALRKILPNERREGRRVGKRKVGKREQLGDSKSAHVVAGVGCRLQYIAQFRARMTSCPVSPDRYTDGLPRHARMRTRGYNLFRSLSCQLLESGFYGKSAMLSPFHRRCVHVRAGPNTSPILQRNRVKYRKRVEHIERRCSKWVCRRKGAVG